MSELGETRWGEKMADFDTYDYWKEEAQSLQSRLSAVEKERDGWESTASVHAQGKLDLQTRLFAAEEQTAQAEDDVAFYRQKALRAEEVVEAAKRIRCPSEHQELEDAIRRYEEGKDATTASPVVLP